MPHIAREGWRRARPGSFWLDADDRPAARPALQGRREADLVVVGGGFSGLWSALRAAEREPGRRVVLLEGDRIASAATGRNGGFCAASLTHGDDNGRARFPRELPELQRLGLENLDGIEQSVERHGIDCGFERTGELSVATEPYQLADLEGEPDPGADVVLLDRDGVRAEVASPAYLGGSWDRRGCAMLDPARLAWGLAAAAERLGVEIAERSRVRGIRADGTGVEVTTDGGAVRADRAVIATGAHPSPLKRLRLFTVPVYDYVLMTEPLTPDQKASIGWSNRQGVGDMANRFHYYRLTADDRILWGGYDAIYHYGRGIGRRFDERAATFALLEQHFFDAFPQLDGLGFSHRWGGAIDTCTRFCAFFGTVLGGRAAYALGYTGLGVGASRFGADVMLDLLSGAPTARTELEFVRSTPLPFPPEPLASFGVQITRRALARADANEGRRGLWLRALDAAGLGFDS